MRKTQFLGLSTKPSRKQRYDESPQSSLPASSLIRLAHLGFADEWAEVTVKDTGLYYRGEYYKPKAQDSESAYRWLNAAGRSHKVPLYVLPLGYDNNDQDKLVIACLDVQTWEEVIPVKSRLLSAKKHVGHQRSALKRKKQELSAIYDEMQAVLAKHYV